METGSTANFTLQQYYFLRYLYLIFYVPNMQILQIAVKINNFNCKRTWNLQV